MGVCTSTMGDGKLKVGGLELGRMKRRLIVQAAGDNCDEEKKGRLISNGVGRGCCAFFKQGRKGINQDCMLVWEDFGGQYETTFCGVFDGHGPMGHLVARDVRDSMPSLLLNEEYSYMCKPSNLGLACNGNNSLGKTALVSEECERIDPMWRRSFVEIYKKMDEKLKIHPQLNCICSGTTAVTLLVQHKDLVIANVGDSRAILASRREDSTLSVDQLTVDFKPNLPGELERIRSCKGRVFALEDEPEVARVWLPNENRPGLAMARALGDFCLKEYGLSAIPHVCHRKLSEHDEFIVLATDGVWDVMTNEEVASIVDRVEPKGGAAKSVVDAATRKWKHKYSHVRMDDCAVVCHFLSDKHAITQYSNPCSASKQQILEASNAALHSYNTISTKNVILPHFDRGI